MKIPAKINRTSTFDAKLDFEFMPLSSFAYNDTNLNFHEKFIF